LVLPDSVTTLPEPTQLATIARTLARVALHVPWLEELPPGHIEALLVAAARIMHPTYGQDELDVMSLKLVAQYEPSLTKELSRKHRQALEKLAPIVKASTTPGPSSPQPPGRHIRVDALIAALAKAELRIAYLLTGDALATVDELRGLDASFLHATEKPGRAALAATLEHPFAGDVVRYALSAEATALRKRVGSCWAG
jgi:hypothetical protein